MRLLQRDGHRIHRMRTVAEALASLAVLRSCDLLILDVLLPTGGAADLDAHDHYTGRTLLRVLKERHGFDRPVIACTVVTNRDVLAELESLGVTSILNKTETTAARLKQEADKVFGGIAG